MIITFVLDDKEERLSNCKQSKKKELSIVKKLILKYKLRINYDFSLTE